MARFADRRGMSALRIILLSILAVALVAIGFDFMQRMRRDSAVAAVKEMQNNPVRDPNDERKILKPSDPNKPPATRDDVHSTAFDNGAPYKNSPEGGNIYDEYWSFPGVFYNYIVEVSYNRAPLSAEDEAKLKDGQDADGHKFRYILSQVQGKEVSHFDNKPLIDEEAAKYRAPSYQQPQVASVGAGGGGGGGGENGGRRGGRGRGSALPDDTEDAGRGGNGANGGGANTDQQKSDPPLVAPPAGDAGKGDAGTGDAGAGDAGKGDAGTGDAGAGGSGDAGKSGDGN